MIESQLQTKLLKALKPYGWFYKASDRFRAGIPDVIGCYMGRFIALELKIEPNKPTKLQTYEINAILEKGGTALVVSYNNKTKLYKSGNEEFKTIGETVQCILRQSLLNTNVNVSTLSETGTTSHFSWSPDSGSPRSQ